MKVPDIRADMEKLKLDILGFFNLKRMQIELDQDQYYVDIELLAVAPTQWTAYDQIKAARALKKIEEDPEGIKCCMILDDHKVEEGRYQINDYIYGYARLI